MTLGWMDLKEEEEDTHRTLLLLSKEPSLTTSACRLLLPGGASAGPPPPEEGGQMSRCCVEDRFTVSGVDVVTARCALDSRVGHRMVSAWRSQPVDSLVFLLTREKNDSQYVRSLELFFSLLPSLPARVVRVVLVTISDPPFAREEISDLQQRLGAYVEEGCCRSWTLVETSDASEQLMSEICGPIQMLKRRSDTLDTAPSLHSATENINFNNHNNNRHNSKLNVN
jgi:hypothetical protein